MFRVVWRLAKDQKSGMMTTKPKCEVINQYLEKIIMKILSENYLIPLKIVYIPVDKLHYLAKVFFIFFVKIKFCLRFLLCDII